MLRHVPDGERLGPEDICSVFNEIIQEEFAEAAEGWEAVLGDNRSVTVYANEKKIVIPREKKLSSPDNVRQLVVHEVGVHMLRAINGASTDTPLLGLGVAGYGSFEEGLGVVMEQALQKNYKERGVDHYITAGAAWHDNMSFREAYEMKWRLGVLQKENVTEEGIVKAQDKAYRETQRIFRGTDELPFLKDLSYYNGATSVWQHLEKIRGDDMQFIFMLLGKVDPTQKHDLSYILESGTKILSE